MMARWGGLACLLCACGRHAPTLAPQDASPSANTIAISVGLGACDDVRLCQAECDAGSADRCRRLGASLAFGVGTARDEGQAVVLYSKACSMNDAAACVLAGQMHEYAHGVPKDATVAAGLYAKACALGWAAGCYNEGLMLEMGRGVGVDLPKARSRYEVACSAGSETACRKLHDNEPFDASQD